MRADTTRALLALNQRFYTAHASAFDATRQRAWPGWDRSFASLPGGRPLAVLDAGCGNGRLAPYVAARWPIETFVGLDRSIALLSAAREATGPAATRIAMDLWADGTTMLARDLRFDLITLFSVLHHVPGRTRRAQLVRDLAGRLRHDGGRLVVTFWRFADTPEFPRRHLPWPTHNATAAMPIDERDLEAGDHLLTWSGDTTSPRYCHHADDDEIEAVIAASGLHEIDVFDADGRRGEGNRYVVLGHREGASE